jgi:hypothetical protein
MVREILKKFLGVSKLSERAILPVVAPEYNKTALPFLCDSTEIHQVRFLWDRDIRDKNNSEAIDTLTAHAQLLGGEFVAGAGELLPLILKPDLRKLVIEGYGRLRKVWKGTNIKKEEGEVQLDPELTKTKRDNRAKVVSISLIHVGYWRLMEL